MTAVDDITFLGILNDKVHHFRLDSLTAYLVFSGDNPKQPAPFLSCCLFLVCTFIFLLALLRPQDLKEDHIHTRVALQALVTVVVPTCSLWPSHYIQLASASRSCIDIPLEVIIKDTMNGVIEFRNPSSDLADLIGSGAIANEYTIRTKIGWKWWIKCFKWWMLSKSKSDHPSSRSAGYTSDWEHRNLPTANPTPLDLSQSSLTLTSSASCPLFCLNYLPYDLVPTLNSGCKVILEFTAFSPSLRMLSTARIVSAIPFMISVGPRRWPRQPASVVKQLRTSYGSNVVINSLSNVSCDYERVLRHAYKSFSGKQKVRETWVKTLGIKAWRREMFLVALEVALIRRGWIERWAVQVTVQ